MTPLAAWDVPQGSRSEPLGDGLINETFRVVHGGDTVGVLQRLAGLHPQPRHRAEVTGGGPG